MNLTGGVYVNQSAAFSDFHATGANPAANASFTDEAFVTPRFHVTQSRRHLPPAEQEEGWQHDQADDDGGIIDDRDGPGGESGDLGIADDGRQADGSEAGGSEAGTKAAATPAKASPARKVTCQVGARPSCASTARSSVPRARSRVWRSSRCCARRRTTR